jgi:hypothetical protein
MRIEIFVILITAFLIYNAYYDNKYTKLLYTYKKYYKIIFYACLGIGVYLFLKKSPQKGKQLLYYANNAIKYLPIEKSTMDVLSPILDFTSNVDQSFMESLNDINPIQSNSLNRIKNSGKNSNKRSVSETKKKYVASHQNWICGHCNCQLDHTYEIDHRLRLEYGGGNDVDNLIALCRNCHGKKTAEENM